MRSFVIRLCLMLGLFFPALASAVIPASERAVLVDIYNSTNGAGWTNKTNWNGVVGTECYWYGVTCDSGQNHVTEVSLIGNNLVGTLPSLSGLTALFYFYADNNQLTGSIPSLSGLTSLSALGVGGNQLTGSIPSLSGLPNLYVFRVSNNQLTGSIPPLSGLTGLGFFSVMGNQLTGPVPAAPASLHDGGSNLCGNSLVSSGDSLTDIAWSAANGSDWLACQATVPGAPTSVSAAAGDTQITVSFTAPASDGGSAITGYTANCGGVTGAGTASPITVTGLTNGTAYTCTVTAANRMGSGTASAASNSATPVTPAAPPACTLTASPDVISAGSASTLSASCSPAATTYTWTIDANTTPHPGAVFASSRTVYPVETFTYSVTGSNASGSGNTASATVTVSSKTSQSISFGAAPTVAVGSTGTVSATATSGLAVSFSSTTANICTVSGSTVTGIAAGTCTIAANQAGNASYNAATQVTQDILVFVTSTVINGDEGSGSSASVAGGWTFGNGSGGFIPVTGHQKSPPSLPPGHVFLQDLFDFIAIGGTPGSTATVTLNYSHPLPQGVVYWKYGPQTVGGASSWYQYSNFTISANRKQITLTITDGQPGDDDLTANGTIVDAGGPGVLLSAAGGPFAYITHFNSNYVSVVDVTTNTVVSTVTVGQSPEALAIHPDGSEVYVGNYLSNNVSVIDTATMAQTALTTVGTGPRGLAVAPDGKRLYVANNGSGTVSVIDIATMAVLVTINVGSDPWGIVVTPDSGKVYVANWEGNSVSVISAASNTVSKTISSGSSPFGLAMSPDGSKVYVANFGSNAVAVIDTATDTVSASIAVDSGPFGLALSLDGSRLYVTTNANTVSVTDTATNTAISSIPVGNHPMGVSVSSDGSKVFVANYDGNTLSVISTATNSVTATITMADGPVAFGNFIAPSNADATAVEFYHAVIDHYFMTASSDEAAFLDSKSSWGWVRTGKTFKVWLPASAPSNASPVCRFYGVFSNGTVGSHFYTADAGECAYVKSRLDWGWGYENDAFYAVRAIELTVPAYSLCPGGTSPVYRAYNNGMGGAPNHRYMTSQADVDAMVAQGWVSEGTRFCSGQ